MIEAINGLWSLMTIFFTTEVIYQPLFMGMLLFIPIFYAVYIYMELMNPHNWFKNF